MSLHIQAIYAFSTNTSTATNPAKTLATGTPIATTPTVTPITTATTGGATPSPTSQLHGPLPSPEQIIPTTTLNFTAQILISIIIMLVALATGFYLRRRLLAYLKKTIL